ncbi:lactonase family protein [Sporolactobacillus sp. THM7-4]|nr:lactonase family protein [Sporolactobacillus sp. THM7-4]
MSVYRGYVGTYTKGESRGIYSFDLDTDQPVFSKVQVAAELENPTYLTISKDNQRLYTVIKEGMFGGVAAYRIDSSGRLSKLSTEMIEGAPPCYVSVDRKNRFVLSANYHKGTLDIYPTDTDRGIKEKSDTVRQTGSGPDKSRQEGPHLHFADFTPDEKYIVSVDLGTDQLSTYEESEGQLRRKDVYTFNPGTGPRHLVFHPAAPFAYVMSELSNEVIALRFDKESGHFSPLQIISSVKPEFEGHSQGAAIKITSDGRFVYVSNRGENSIAVFKTNSESGQLSLVEHVSTAGEWPRDFELDPSEKFLIVANQYSGNLVLYARDSETGRLTLNSSDSKVPDPVCVKFLHVRD